VEDFFTLHCNKYFIIEFRPSSINTVIYLFCFSDQVIYPGKVLNADCFRIGSIGYLFPDDVRHLLTCIKQVCADMNIGLPLQGN